MPSTTIESPRTITRSDGEQIAYCVDGEASASVSEVLWCGGFASDMTGEKASSLAAWGRSGSRRVVRFDYLGHGQSTGAFADGSIGRWKDDAAFVQEKLMHGPHVLVGSSMGGWISLLLALHHPERVAGLLLLAPAQDFTEQLLWEKFAPEERRKCREQGFLHLGNPDDEDFDESYVITWKQIEEARDHLLPQGKLPIDCPVRIIHGMLDDAVPWRRSLELVERIESPNVVLTLSKDSDHRLSSRRDLCRIREELDDIFQSIGS